jgi:RNA polymerase sigma-70 factor (ECF subfamily)
MLQDETEALDLAQESFVRVYLHRAKFNPKHRFSTWLFTIAANLARDRIRWLTRHPTVSLHSTPSAGSAETGPTLADTLAETSMGPNERFAQAERVEQIKEALAEIPEDLRTPLVLAEYEDRSQADIAAILNCTVKAVENRLYRARKLLRDKLAHLLG